jgi:hypothetical protein
MGPQEADELVRERIRPKGKQKLEDQRGCDGGSDIGEQKHDAERLPSPYLAREKQSNAQTEDELDRDGKDRVPDCHAQGIKDFPVPLGAYEREREEKSDERGCKKNKSTRPAQTRAERRGPAQKRGCNNDASDRTRKGEERSEVCAEQRLVVAQPQKTPPGESPFEKTYKEREKKGEYPEHGDDER